MRLADFILTHVEHILAEWEIFARGITAGAGMDSLALRDHAQEILLATARDMNSSQSIAQQYEKSRGRGLPQEGGRATLNGASELHAVDRLGCGFDLLEVVSEYRALRTSVLQLWRESNPQADLRDVDDLTRFNESIDQSLTKAVAIYTRRVDQARDLFLAILSHDLRNPLNSIAMSAQLLPHLGADVQEAMECVSQISTNVAVMGRMIGDLLDYTRTRLGAGMPVSPAPMDMRPLGRSLFDEFRTAHPDRAFNFHADGDLNGEWDVDRLRQAISNLLGNAVQHGDPNFPVDLALSGEDAMVFIAVGNGGAPIPPGELGKIFDPLVRGSSAAKPAKNRPGSIGLGLYIARQVAMSHGGDIAVTSTQAAGTTFTIRLPRHPSIRSGRPILDEPHIQTM